MQNVTMLQGILKQRCPRCREGKMFLHSPLSYRKFDKMNETCPVCSLRFEVEPGFFWGAMYISYALSIGIMFVFAFTVYNVFSDPPLWIILVCIPFLLLSVVPLLFQYSRVVWLYFFAGIRYTK